MLEFIFLTHAVFIASQQITIPPRGKIYSFNEGNAMYFHPPVTAYLKSIKYPTAPKSPYSARYIGSMVADVHRTLLYGGIFGYPNDKKSKSGKLRLLYEAFPMAFLTEQVRLFAFGGSRLDLRLFRLGGLRRRAQNASSTSFPPTFMNGALCSLVAEMTFWTLSSSTRKFLLTLR